jgi:hypothetical protein
VAQPDKRGTPGSTRAGELSSSITPNHVQRLSRLPSIEAAIHNSTAVQTRSRMER